MDKQTWAGALKQVRETLKKWPIIYMVPLSIYFATRAEPWATRLTIAFLGLCVGMAIYHAVQIQRILRAHKKRREADRIAMDRAELEVERCAAELKRLFKIQLELTIDGKAEEAEAMQKQIHAIVEEQTRWMLASVGLKETDTQ